jgi:cyclohexanecarboxylate-CoA ligase
VILEAPGVIERWRAAGWWGSTTIDDLFRACVAQVPDQLALVDAPNRNKFAAGEPRQLTFHAVDQLVDKLAAALYGLGVRKDDVVLVQLPNIVEIVIAYLACIRLGAIVSPVMLAYGERDLRRIVRHLRPTAMLTLAEFKGGRPARVAAAIAAESARPLAVLALGDEDAAGVTCISLDELPGDVTAVRDYLATITIDAGEIVVMQWTSGTTGDPKCVPRSHNNMHAIGSACADGGGLQPGERILAPMQMVHTSGWSGMFMPWLEKQGLLAMHHPFDIQVFLEQIETLRINHTVAAPAMLNALLKSGALEGRDISSIRSMLCGSAPLDAWMIDGYKQRYGIEIVNAYGSTEGLTFLCGPTISDEPYRRARYFPRLRGRDTDTGGKDWGLRIVPVMETRLRDMDTGTEIHEPRRPGEMLFRSPALFPGYWTAGHTIDRRDFDADGYFRSGEIFEIAGDGDDSRFYHYIDRLKDVINRGGLKIPAGELEAPMNEHPGISEAVAIGYPDEKLGERICAAVVLRPGATLALDELVGWLVEKGVARFMLPERLEVVESLPRNLSGKPLKRELAAWLRARNATQ